MEICLLAADDFIIGRMAIKKIQNPYYKQYPVDKKQVSCIILMLPLH